MSVRLLGVGLYQKAVTFQGITSLWLIVCDALMGSWSDRVKPKRGRTPFLLAGAVLTSLAFVALFWHTGYSSTAVAALVTCLQCIGTMLVTAALLKSNPKPSVAEIRAAITNICRCGTYPRIVAAIAQAGLTES